MAGHFVAQFRDGDSPFRSLGQSALGREQRLQKLGQRALSFGSNSANVNSCSALRNIKPRTNATRQISVCIRRGMAGAVGRLGASHTGHCGNGWDAPRAV